jgi:hypothetical protein
MPRALAALAASGMVSASAAAAAAAASTAALPSSLTPPTYAPLQVGSVTPKGWLLKQLRLQAEGLSGHLSMFWDDIKNTVWLGGTGDGGLHERTPYWLNGVVPLSYLLRNADGQHILPGVRGIYKASDGFGHGHDSAGGNDGDDHHEHHHHRQLHAHSDRNGKHARHGEERRLSAVAASNGGVAGVAVFDAPGTCENNTDMPYQDITDFACASQAECFATCNGTSGAVGWVWDECDKHCW